MIFDRSALGAATLVGSRKNAGITQEQLAERTGLSVRTIRELEAGRVLQPRRSSLDLLVSALGLADDEARRFLTSWSENRSTTSVVELLALGCDLTTLLAVQSTRGFCDVVLLERMVIGPDRKMVSRHTSTVMEAEQDGLTHRLVLFGTDDQNTFDRSDVRLLSASGCRSWSTVLSEERGFAAFDLTFPRPLNKGDTHLVSYETALGPHTRSELRPPVSSDIALRGFHRPVMVLAMHVQFVGCAPPAHATEVRRVGAQLDQHMRDLPIMDDTIELVLRNMGPGIYGINWSW